jgi:class 3 adenylate cyclase
MPEPPRGTVTFLFSDIEHSTRLLRHLGDRYADVLAEYRRLLRETEGVSDLLIPYQRHRPNS